MNPFLIIYILKRSIPGENILMLYFLSASSRTKLTVVLLWILLVSVYLLNKLGTFLPSASVIPQDLARQQDTSQLQTTSADLWTF
jgi:hypothetical protein